MDLAWAPPVTGELIDLAEDRYETGAGLDEDIGQDEEEAMDLQVAEALSGAAEESGILLPAEDQFLAAVLQRDAKPAPAIPRLGVVLQLADGRLAVGVGRGMTVESSGESLALIEAPEPGRYVRAWFIPGLFYWEER